MLKMIVLATNNRNKVLEFQEILKDYKIELKCIADFGPLPEAVENGDTFDLMKTPIKRHFIMLKFLAFQQLPTTLGWLSRPLTVNRGCFLQDMPVKMPPMKKIA